MNSNYVRGIFGQFLFYIYSATFLLLRVEIVEVLMVHYVFLLGAQSAWDMLHEEKSCKSITTSCSDLDEILGGGINCKEVTEIG